jgi:hypothetical protein
MCVTWATKHLSAREPIDLGQQALERIPGRQALLDALGQIVQASMAALSSSRWL